MLSIILQGNLHCGVVFALDCGFQSERFDRDIWHRLIRTGASGRRLTNSIDYIETSLRSKCWRQRKCIHDGQGTGRCSGSVQRHRVFCSIACPARYRMTLCLEFSGSMLLDYMLGASLLIRSLSMEYPAGNRSANHSALQAIGTLFQGNRVYVRNRSTGWCRMTRSSCHAGTGK
jgi:hypothetical protein